MSSIVVARDLSFEFSNGRELFSHLSLSLDTKRIALVGPNGVGKSFLAKLLVGEIEPTAGRVHRYGSVQWLPQHESQPSISVAEYLAADYEWSLHGDRLLREIDFAAQCTTLSGGQWMRVRLARALNADFLILDEPTNDLDGEARETVMQFIRSHAGGSLLISHDRACLELCEEILELSNQGLMKFTGGWANYLGAKQAERQRLSAELARAKRERDAAVELAREQHAKQEKRSRQGARAAARGGAPAIVLGGLKRRAQATTGRIDVAMIKKAAKAVRVAHQAFEDLKVDPVMYSDFVGRPMPAQKLVAEASGFNVRFDRWLYAVDLDFAWHGNVRVAVRGANGSGKSTLLRALLGERFQTRGELRVGTLASLYIDQTRSVLDDDLSVFENVRAVATCTDAEIRNQLARFLFAKDAVLQKAGALSGGERLRAALARGLLSSQAPELLLLDEPTNNLDLANIEFLEGLVDAFRGAVVIVSHDEHFLQSCRVMSELHV